MGERRPAFIFAAAGAIGPRYPAASTEQPNGVLLAGPGKEGLTPHLNLPFLDY